MQAVNNWDLYRYAHRGGGGSGTTDTRFKSLVERTITDVSDDSITAVGEYAFCKCNSLMTVDLPNAITVGTSVFQGCTFLSDVNLPNVTTAGGSAFYGCKNLTSINIQNLYAVESMMFNGCSGITTINFPNVNRISTNGFSNCSNLKMLDMPNVTVLGNSVFSSCTSLTTVILRTATVATLTNINAFANTPIADGTGYIYVPDELVDSYKIATNWVTYADQIKPLSEYGGD